MARQEETLVGRTIAGKFAIEAHIGSGAMGQVYRARQIALEKTVAVKVLHQDLASDETFATRFHREAMAASRLDHPNSMRVIDFGVEPDGMLYIAMEFLDGKDLHHILYEEGVLPEARSVDILTQALAALVVAHDMGVIHRDLKPENIMILEGTDDEGRRIDIVKVCDFGIAKISGKTLAGARSDAARGPLTTQGLVVGTPEFMSPEQGRGDPLDARSDLYSVGVMLFQLLTGKLPFKSETALGLVFKQVNEAPPQPSSLRADVDPHLEWVCLKAMSKRPDDRFQTAREMRSALRGFSGGDGSRLPSGPITVPVLQSTAMEHAETLSLPALPSRDSIPGGSRVEGAPLPALPVSQPSTIVVACGAIVVGALLVAAWAQWHAPPPLSPAGPPLLDASTSPAPVDAFVAAAPTVSASSVPARVPSQATTVHATSIVAQHPPKVQAITPAPVDAAVGGFSLTTSAANPTVTRATGVTVRDVRAALPSWKFTQCYRTALQQTNRALEGHVTLSLTIDATGAVTKVLARGAGPLFSTTSECMLEAVSHVSIGNVAAAGSAEVDLACAPR